MNTSEQLRQELATANVGNKVSDPTAILRWAQDHPISALHHCFEWDDAEAARRYREALA